MGLSLFWLLTLPLAMVVVVTVVGDGKVAEAIENWHIKLVSMMIFFPVSCWTRFIVDSFLKESWNVMMVTYRWRIQADSIIWKKSCFVDTPVSIKTTIIDEAVAPRAFRFSFLFRLKIRFSWAHQDNPPVDERTISVFCITVWLPHQILCAIIFLTEHL